MNEISGGLMLERLPLVVEAAAQALALIDLCLFSDEVSDLHLLPNRRLLLLESNALIRILIMNLNSK